MVYDFKQFEEVSAGRLFVLCIVVLSYSLGEYIHSFMSFKSSFLKLKF